MYTIVKPDGTILFTDTPQANGDSINYGNHTSVSEIPEHLINPLEEQPIEESIKETVKKSKPTKEPVAKAEKKRRNRHAAPEWYIKGGYGLKPSQRNKARVSSVRKPAPATSKAAQQGNAQAKKAIEEYNRAVEKYNRQGEAYEQEQIAQRRSRERQRAAESAKQRNAAMERYRNLNKPISRDSGRKPYLHDSYDEMMGRDFDSKYGRNPVGKPYIADSYEEMMGRD